MKKDTRKIASASHAWLGVVTSLVLFVVCFSGAISVFHDAIAEWENPMWRKSTATPSSLSTESIVQIAREHSDYPKSFDFAVGIPYEGLAKFRYKHAGKHQTLMIDRTTGQILPDSGSNISEVLTRLHTDLDLPSPYGRYLVGLSGVILLYLILTAVIQHRRFFKDAFRFRIGGQYGTRRRLTISDLHKVLGTWGIVFQAMMAFTGTVLGLVGLILLAMAFTAYKGDRQAAIEGFLGKTPSPTGISAPMLAMDNLIQMAESYQTDTQVRYVRVKNYGDENAQIMAYLDTEKQLTAQLSVNLSAVTGQVTFVSDFRKIGIGGAIYSASTTLHFAEFGGTVIKWLYLLLGVAMSGMGVSGMMMWLERQRKSTGKYTFFSRLTVGVVCGLMAATIMLFFTAMGYPDSWGNKATLQHKTYYWVWVAMIVCAYCFPTIRGYVRFSLGCCGLLVMAAPLLNYYVTGHSVVHSLLAQHYSVMGVDLTLLAIGVVLIWGCRRLGKLGDNLNA